MESIDKIHGTYEKKLLDTERPQVSSAVIKRLPRYHRYLGDLLRAGTLRISSGKLAKLMGVTASQIRQDFNCFGGFGQQGYGYNIKYLHSKIAELLGVDEGFSAVIVGAGNLGKALASTHMFERRGISRLALFDIDEKIIGTTINGLRIYPLNMLKDFCLERHVDIGVLTVPKEAADEVAKILAEGGVRGIWNFANMELVPPSDEVIVENIHLGDSLMTLCYELKNHERVSEVDDE